MMNTIELKEKLEMIKNNNYYINEDEIENLIFIMMKNIGSTDALLRDNFIYYTFYKWTEKNYIKKEQMKDILNIALGENNLFFKIGENNTDSIFTRSFSALIIPLALYLNNIDEFLNKEDILNIKNNIIKYLTEEKDFRGYVEEKGWADGIGHGLDVVDSLASSKLINHKELKELLELILNLIKNKDYVYITEEDIRFSRAFISIYNRNLISDEEFLDFFNRLMEIEDTIEMNYKINLEINIRNFLQNLYFKLLREKNENLLKLIEEKIFKLI